MRGLFSILQEIRSRLPISTTQSLLLTCKWLGVLFHVIHQLKMFGMKVAKQTHTFVAATAKITTAASESCTFIHSMQQKGDKKTSAWMRCIAFILTPVSSGAMRSIYLCTMNREYLFNGANYYYCSWTVRKIQFPQHAQAKNAKQKGKSLTNVYK